MPFYNYQNQHNGNHHQIEQKNLYSDSVAQSVPGTSPESISSITVFTEKSLTVQAKNENEEAKLQQVCNSRASSKDENAEKQVCNSRASSIDEKAEKQVCNSQKRKVDKNAEEKGIADKAIGGLTGKRLAKDQAQQKQ